MEYYKRHSGKINLYANYIAIVEWICNKTFAWTNIRELREVLANLAIFLFSYANKELSEL